MHLFTTGSKRQFYGMSVVALLLLLTLCSPATFAATAVSQTRDCDANAIFNCGALTTQELIKKYMNPNDGSGRFVLNAFGISNQDITELEAKAVTGRVTKDGQVFIGRELVATNALTAGRQNMPGSTKANTNGVTYYKRSPSVSFRSNSLDAFVVMDNNKQFKYAILTSCGNPVVATPVTSKPPVPITPAAATPKKQTPPPEVVEVKQDLTPPATPVKVLPDTGPGNMLVFAALTSIISALGHNFYLRKRAQRGSVL